MIILRLVHGIPRGFRPTFGGVAAGVGAAEGGLTIGLSPSGVAAGVGDVEGSLALGVAGSVAGVGGAAGSLAAAASIAGSVAGVGDIGGQPSLFFPSLDFSDARNSQYLGQVV